MQKQFESDRGTEWATLGHSFSCGYVIMCVHAHANMGMCHVYMHECACMHVCMMGRLSDEWILTKFCIWVPTKVFTKNIFPTVSPIVGGKAM